MIFLLICNITFPCGPINTIRQRGFRPISDSNFFPKPVFIMTLHVIGKFVTGYHLLIKSTLSECILEACTCTTHCTKHWTTTRHVVLFPKLKLCSGNAMVVLNFIIPTYNRMSIKFSCWDTFSNTPLHCINNIIIKIINICLMSTTRHFTTIQCL